MINKCPHCKSDAITPWHGNSEHVKEFLCHNCGHVWQVVEATCPSCEKPAWWAINPQPGHRSPCRHCGTVVELE